MNVPVPFLLTEESSIPWTPQTLRRLGKDERFLERAIGANPALLCLEDRRTQIRGRYAVFHQLKLETPQGRTVYPDIVMLCESGHVVVVEVKLADNPELAQRAVVAQVLDYASALAGYTTDELVELFGGEPGSGFADIIKARFPDCHQPHELADVLVERLRAADLHLVIACDGAPSGLREFVQGVSSQSASGAYELRVAVLTPFTTSTHPGVLLLPTTPTRTEIVARTAVHVTYAEGQPRPEVQVRVTSQDEVAEAVRQAKSTTPRELRPDLAAAIDAYDLIAAPEWKTQGTATKYRQIRPIGWPPSVHYEFLAFTDGIGVELHLESAKLGPVRSAAIELGDRLRATFPDIVWDPAWGKGGRLAIRLVGSTPDRIARTMHEFIESTRNSLEAAVSNLQGPSNVS